MARPVASPPRAGSGPRPHSSGPGRGRHRPRPLVPGPGHVRGASAAAGGGDRGGKRGPGRGSEPGLRGHGPGDGPTLRPRRGRGPDPPRPRQDPGRPESLRRRLFGLDLGQGSTGLPLLGDLRGESHPAPSRVSARHPPRDDAVLSGGSRASRVLRPAPRDPARLRAGRLAGGGLRGGSVGAARRRRPRRPEPPRLLAPDLRGQRHHLRGFDPGRGLPGEGGSTASLRPGPGLRLRDQAAGLALRPFPARPPLRGQSLAGSGEPLRAPSHGRSGRRRYACLPGRGGARGRARPPGLLP